MGSAKNIAKKIVAIVVVTAAFVCIGLAMVATADDQAQNYPDAGTAHGSIMGD